MARSQTYTQACSKVGSFDWYTYFTLYVVLTDRDGDPATNKSWVDYEVYCSSSGTGSLNANHALYFELDGQIYRNETVKWNQNGPYIKMQIAKGSKQVDHTNKTNIYFNAWIKANSYGVSAAKSGYFDLEYIPRYFSQTPSISETGKTLTSVTFKWTTSETCDRVDYNINGTAKESAWTGSATSGNITISGLNPNTKNTIYAWCRRKDSQLGSTSNTIAITTHNIATITEAPNVNIGSSHTIKWTNPSGAAISLKLCKTDGTQVINYGTVTGTSKAVTPTASTIYALTPKSNTITLRYILTTTQNNKSYTSYKDCVFSVTNSNPTFSNFTYQDTDSTTLALTGNNQTIIKGYSNVKGIVSAANKATAKNSATMSKYRLSIGEKTAEVAYSSSAEVSTTISDVSSNSFTMYAIDSRGNSTGKTITASKYINYTPIKITSISLIRTNSVTSETTLKFSGTIWDGSFGTVTNKIKSCSYRYKLSTASSWTTGTTTITPTKSGSSFSFTGIIAGDLGANGFNINNSYNIQVLISDELTNNNNTPASFTLGPGTPAMAIHKNNVAVGQRYDTNDSTVKFQVNGRGRFKQGTSVRLLRGGEQQSGYMYACRITINRAYANQYMEFGVVQRNRRGKLYLCFSGIDSKDPGVASFWKSGTTVAYISKATTSTWDLYIQKTEWYDDIEVVELHKGNYMDDVSIEWKGQGVTALPSSYTTATTYLTKSATSITNLGYGTNNNFYPDISMIAYWNGAYDSNNASNLKYCSKGGIRGDSFAQIYWGRQTINASTAWTQYSYGTVSASKSGGRLSVSGNNIVVGSGVSRVKITLSCQAYANLNGGGDRISYVKVGDTWHGVHYNSPTGAWDSGGAGSLIADVSNGTKITAGFAVGIAQSVEHLGVRLIVEDLT